MLPSLMVACLSQSPDLMQVGAKEPPAFVRRSFQQGGRWYHGVIVRLSQATVSAETVYYPRLVSPWKAISEHAPKAAITGTFFAWENQQPVADVLVNGQLKVRGYRGSVVAIDWLGQARIFDSEFGRPVDWTPYRFALRGAVRLMSGGVVSPNPRAQKFRDPAIWGRAARTSVGVTKEGDLILCATASRATLSEIGNALKTLGAVDAISLDGGGSTMLYWNGDMIVPTSRRLCNLLVVHDRPPIFMP